MCKTLKRNEKPNFQQHGIWKNSRKIKFDSDDDLPLNKQLNFYSMAVAATCIFEENNKLNSQLFLWVFVWSRKMLIFERIDISEEINFDKLMNQKSVWSIITGFLKMKNLILKKRVCNGCHDISIMCYELENIAIFKIKGVDYECVLWNITDNETFDLLNNSKLDERDSL